MQKFKVGDKVKIKDSERDDEVRFNSLKKGKVYTVVDIDDAILFVNRKLGAFISRFEHTKESEYSLKRFEKDIRKFNERCGNVDCTPEMSLDEVCSATLPQAKVILEEAKELLKACEEQNEQELIDGAVDCCVTTLRLLSLLGKRYDLMKAAQLVMENNHLKYTTDAMLANKWAMKPDGSWSGFSIITTDQKGTLYYCLKDENGKIRKWTGFPKVELNVEELRK